MEISNLINAAGYSGNSTRHAAAQPARTSDSPPQTNEARPNSAPQDVKQAVRQINREISNTDRFLDFSVDKETGKTIVKVIDRESKKVLEQFPSEDIVQIARSLGKLQGLFIRQKV